MGLWQDVQFAARLFVKDKWFTLVATLALAFGIGVNTTVFTFVNAVLIRGLPYPIPIGLRRAVADRPRDRRLGVSYLDFTGLVGGHPNLHRRWRRPPARTMNLSDEGRAPERYNGVFISA